MVRLETVTDKGRREGHALQELRWVQGTLCAGHAVVVLWYSGTVVVCHALLSGAYRRVQVASVLRSSATAPAHRVPFPVSIPRRPGGEQQPWVQSQTTFAVLHREEDGSYAVRAVKQKIWVEGVSYELQVGAGL